MTARLSAAVTLLSGAAVLFGPTWLAVPCGLLLGFVLPGLALTRLPFRSLNAVERIVLVPALSLAVLIGAGLIMYVAGYALDRTSWTSATAGVTLVALLVGALLRSPRASLPPVAAVGRISRQLAPMILVAAILGLGGWLSFSDARRVADVTVTALSAAPPDSVAAGRRSARITASGLVATDGPYSLVVIAPRQQAIRRTIEVSGDGSWTANLEIGPDRTTISLYRARDAAPYRTLYIAAEP